jgi:GH3 auxin-responsive promoter
MSFILKAANFVTVRQWRRWVELTKNPGAIQRQRLREIIGRNRATRFGRDHRFDEIRTLDEYRKQVAIEDYERLRPYIERAKSGGAAELTEDPVLMFTVTSGSTGEPKLIPVTAASKKSHHELTRFWYHRAFADHPDLMNGKFLGVVSDADEGLTAGGIPFGAASGLIFQSSPAWIRNIYAIPGEISRIEDYAAKYYVLMRLALDQKISFFGTPNPSTILKLVESADQNKEEIIRDIRDGAIAAHWEIATEIRARLALRLKKNSDRARQLEKFAGEHGALRPSEYWPGLRLIGCWKGGSVGVRLKEFSRWFGDSTPVRDLGYMASEAQMTLPISDSGSAGILDVSANFYEFVPEAEIDNAHPTILTCEELSEGENYYPILTTAAGLYRYDMNDVVRVTGFYNRAPTLEFVRKGRDVTSITGEKIHVNQWIQAMATAQHIAEIEVRHFRACADAQKSLYVFSVELPGAAGPETDRLTLLLRELDGGLAQLNIEYAQKRASGRLAAPVLWVMKPGWFERGSRSSLAGREAQFKAQLLSVTPEDPKEVLTVVELANDGK